MDRDTNESIAGWFAKNIVLNVYSGKFAMCSILPI